MYFKIRTLEEMKTLAEKLASKLNNGSIVSLKGELGAGKTTFAKFIGKALGVSEEIVSPTFNIVKTYQGRHFLLNHIDAYRLQNVKDKEMFDDYIYNNDITIIEWPDFITIRKDVISVEITTTGLSTREVYINGIDL